MSPYTEVGVQMQESSQEPKHNESGAKEGLYIDGSNKSLSSLNTSLTPSQANYELVGVVVHSGQASAGHFYSFIKERRYYCLLCVIFLRIRIFCFAFLWHFHINLCRVRGSSLTNHNKNKWFKFNDTTVEEFDMNDVSLEAECFGGTYKAKVYDSCKLLTFFSSLSSLKIIYQITVVIDSCIWTCSELLPRSSASLLEWVYAVL